MKGLHPLFSISAICPCFVGVPTVLWEQEAVTTQGGTQELIMLVINQLVIQAIINQSTHKHPPKLISVFMLENQFL